MMDTMKKSVSGLSGIIIGSRIICIAVIIAIIIIGAAP
jgi:hypothetical protein